MADLDEIRDKFGGADLKIKENSGKLDRRIQDLDKIITSSDSKKELLANIDEISEEMADDCKHIEELLKTLPKTIKELNHTLQEMKEGSSAPGADYNERKEEILEQLEDLEEIQQDVD